MGFGFSGYLLPWNQLAFFATKVGTDIAGAVPVVGEWLLRFLRGGDRVTGGTLSRFYGWHVAILPALSRVLLGVPPAAGAGPRHERAAAVRGEEAPAARRCGSSPTSRCAISSAGRWRSACWRRSPRSSRGSSARRPTPSRPAYKDIRPEWYFVFMFQTLKLVPGGEIAGIEYEAIPILALRRSAPCCWCWCRSSTAARAATEQPRLHGVGVARLASTSWA